MRTGPSSNRHLHPYVKQRLIGRFSADVASVSNEEIRDQRELDVAEMDYGARSTESERGD